MESIRIPAGAMVVVGDGRKALFLRNRGTAVDPRLETEDVFKQDNPATRDQGTDSPGRRAGGFRDRATALEETDWHDLGEERFARSIADALHKGSLDERYHDLVIVAPPATLGVLRKALSQRVADRVIAEIPKTLTGREVPEIQELLTGVH